MQMKQTNAGEPLADGVDPKVPPSTRTMVIVSLLTLLMLAAGIGLAARYGDLSMSASSMKPMGETAAPMNMKEMPMGAR